MTEPEKKPKIEVPDVLLILGLVLLFVGLGFAISWPIASAVTGAVLIGLGIWLVEPPKAKRTS
jgi:uncharacterized membrane protein HdeD (DUF308 family)